MTKIPMHGRRVGLEKNGYVVHEFPFQRLWNEPLLEDKILEAFYGKGLLSFQFMKVCMVCGLTQTYVAGVQGREEWGSKL